MKFRKMRPAFFIGIAVLILAACAESAEPSQPSDVPEQPAPLAGTDWVLSKLYGMDPVEGTSITIEFTDAVLRGFAGCNSYGAPYSASTDGMLAVLEVELTQEGCIEPEGVLVQEGVLEQALLASVGYELGPSGLAFLDQGGREVIKFVNPVQVAQPTEVPELQASALWSEAVDDRTGLRFAVPCYWEVNIPSVEQDPTGLGSATLRNYNDAWVQAHPRGAIGPDEGAKKMDLYYMPYSDVGLEPGASAEEFVQSLVGPGGESEIISMEPIDANGLEALFVTQEGTFGIGYFAAVPLEEDLVLVIGSGGENSSDFQGILNSIAYLPEASVAVPSFDPAPPPLGVNAPCMGKVFGTGAEDLAGVLACEGVVAGSAESLACEIQAAFLARDMQTLASFMADPFTIGYWGSEGGWGSPEDMARQLGNLWLPQDTSGLTFTTDRALFPPLAGQPADQLFGPDLDPVLLLYSEGWGPDGLGAGILYIVADDSGAFYWSNLAYSHEHFDR